MAWNADTDASGGGYSSLFPRTLWFIAWLRGRWPAHGPLLGEAGQDSLRDVFLPPIGAHRGRGGVRFRDAGT